MATLNVGAGQAYATLSAAVAASSNGDVINVQAGTYVNDFATISKAITIVGVGGMANFVATVAPPNGKGILVTQNNVTIQNLSFSGAAVADGNGAGIRYEGGNLVIIDSYFHDNQDGLLANADSNGTIRIVGSEFANNGSGDGFTHNLYVGNIAALVIDDSYFHDASVGHEIKSRAQSTTITNSRIYDGTGTASYSIDLPNGGAAVIRDNVIEQGPNSENPAIIAYGAESAAYAGSSLLIEGNVVVNDLSSSSARLLYNASTVAGTVSGNSVWGLTAGQIALGSVTVSGTTFLSARPTLDTGALQAGDVIPEAPDIPGQVFRLYEVTLGRGPDVGGFDYWVGNLRGGMPLQTAAGYFIGCAEFQANIGSLNDSQFVNLLYNNALHRAPDPGGLDYWQSALGNGMTRDALVLAFSESDEAKATNKPLVETFIQTQDPGQANVLDGGNGTDTVSYNSASDVGNVSLLTNYMANSFVTSPGEGAGVVDTTASSSAQGFLTRPAA